MSDADKDVKFLLKVMVNKEKRKILFAEADCRFVDVLLSFLTLPLGTIVRILEKHYGDEAPVIGSLTTLYNGVANLDSFHFWTEGAKSILLHPRSSSDALCKSLKLDISDSQPFEYFFCSNDCRRRRFRSLSVYIDKLSPKVHPFKCCYSSSMKREVAKEDDVVLYNDGVFMQCTTSFVITDDLQIMPIDAGLLQIASSLGITDTNKAELMDVTFGYAEVMDLLRASLISSTPLSDIILNENRLTHSKKRKYEQRALRFLIANASTCSSKKMILKVMLQKSTNQFLYALAGKDFVEFLFSFLVIPLGGVEYLFEGNSLIKSIDNLYGSLDDDLIDSRYYTLPSMINRLMIPKIPHGYISENHILPLIEEDLPSDYKMMTTYSENFPDGRGNYLKVPETYLNWATDLDRSRTFMVTDDLTVAPFCIAPALSIINEMKVPLSDVKEVEMQIGLEEALGILRASLTSTSALSNGLGLINHVSRKQPRQEY